MPTKFELQLFADEDFKDVEDDLYDNLVWKALRRYAADGTIVVPAGANKAQAGWLEKFKKFEKKDRDYIVKDMGVKPLRASEIAASSAPLTIRAAKEDSKYEQDEKETPRIGARRRHTKKAGRRHRKTKKAGRRHTRKH